jgi:hypothetical protein
MLKARGLGISGVLGEVGDPRLIGAEDPSSGDCRVSHSGLGNPCLPAGLGDP